MWRTILFLWIKCEWLSLLFFGALCHVFFLLVKARSTNPIPYWISFFTVLSQWWGISIWMNKKNVVLAKTPACRKQLIWSVTGYKQHILNKTQHTNNTLVCYCKIWMIRYVLAGEVHRRRSINLRWRQSPSCSHFCSKMCREIVSSVAGCCAVL